MIRLKSCGGITLKPGAAVRSKDSNYYLVTPCRRDNSPTLELELKDLPSRKNDDNEKHFEDCQSISESGGVEAMCDVCPSIHHLG